jgi:hypothetical protein
LDGKGNDFPQIIKGLAGDFILPGIWVMLGYIGVMAPRANLLDIHYQFDRI